MQDLLNLADAASKLSVAALALLALAAVVKGWVIPRFTYDQVVEWNDLLLDYADRSITAFDKLATIALNAAHEERTEIKEAVDEVRKQLGVPPGPTKRTRKTKAAT